MPNSKFKGEHYSPSQLSLYLSNPRAYESKYILNIEKKKTAALDKGGIIHYIILDYWLKRNPTYSLEKVIKYFNKWVAATVSQEDPKKYKKIYDECFYSCCSLYHYYSKFKNDTYITEHEVLYTINDAIDYYRFDLEKIATKPILNIIDFHAIKTKQSTKVFGMTDKFILLDDLKTTGKDIDKTYNDNYCFTSFQLRSYALALELTNCIPVEEISYTVIKIGKKPQIHKYRIRFEKNWQYEFIKDLIYIVKGIEAGVFPRAYYNNNLHWNPYLKEHWNITNNYQVTHETII